MVASIVQATRKHGSQQVFALEHDGTEIGTLIVGVDDEAIVAAAISHALMILAIAALPCLLAALSILLIFERLVARHLSHLAANVPTLGLNDDPAHVRIHRVHPEAGSVMNLTACRPQS